MDLRSSSSRVVLVALATLTLAAGCGDDGGGGAGGGTGTGTSSSTGSPEQVGQVCEVAADCFPDVTGELSGEALCLDRVRGGYCTHECAEDADCCAAEGECETDLAQVCSPFESTDTKMCFLACEDEDIGDLDEQTFCQREASRDFICRSSGGGSENRKICVPGDCGVGAACGATTDCTGDLECVIDGLGGGYCTRRDCTADAECPADSRCVERGPGDSLCLRTCAGESDCSFCRGDELAAECSDAVTFVEGSPIRVCVPPQF